MRLTYAPHGFEAYGDREIEAVVSSLKSGWLAPGESVKQFEQSIAKIYGKKYGVMVNSGSSANLLAAEELDTRLTATPALTFITTFSYLKNPYLVDVEEGTYQIDFTKIDQAEALFVPNLLGNIPDWSKAPDLPTITDSCDTVTQVHKGIITTSFYASHLITCAGGGGMVMCDDEETYKRLLSKRAWGRTVVEEQDLDSRFTELSPGLVYDARFKFEHSGHNLQPIELQGAFGLAQLKRLNDNLEIRSKVFGKLLAFFEKYEDTYILPKTRWGANWMNFPLTLRKGDRNDFAQYLESQNIQTRPIFTGNITRQPFYKGWAKDFPVADNVMKNGILLGCHQGITDEKLDYLFAKVEEYERRR